MARGESPEAQEALERLCRIYWWPIYGFVRRQGYAPEEAEEPDEPRERFESACLAAGRHPFPAVGTRLSNEISGNGEDMRHVGVMRAIELRDILSVLPVPAKKVRPVQPGRRHPVMNDGRRLLEAAQSGVKHTQI